MKREETVVREKGLMSFPLGFWNYTHVGQQPATSVRDWQAAGMTLTLGPEYGPDSLEIEGMRAILDAAAQAGIRVILCDSRTRWRTLVESGEKQYRDGIRAALRQFGGHPATFGFHVGDEPGAADFESACKAMRILKEMAPNLSPFLNLLPWHPGVEGVVGFASWSAYLDAYVASARPDFLCYDCYSQMNPGPVGLDMYFRNLREYREAAVRAGIPFWTTLLSVGHFRYRCPTENDFRWQLNTALAHGAQGILYFFFYMRAPHDNYRVSPIDEHGERTETFAWLSRVNRTFLKTHAERMRHLLLRTVGHVGTAQGGWPLFDGAGLVSRATTANGTPLIVSEFKHTNGADYVMVVNNSQTESDQATVWFRGRKPSVYRVGWMNVETPADRGDGWQAARGEDFVTVRPWLAPGQMELYRLAQG